MESPRTCADCVQVRRSISSQRRSNVPLPPRSFPGPMGVSVGKGHALAPDAKAFDQRLIPRLVLRLDVVEELPALRHEFEQTTARVVVFHMRLEMLGQIADPLGQDRNLDLRRAGIARLQGIVFQKRLFALCCNRHRITSLDKVATQSTTAGSKATPARAASNGRFAAAAR